MCKKKKKEIQGGFILSKYTTLGLVEQSMCQAGQDEVEEWWVRKSDISEEDTDPGTGRSTGKTTFPACEKILEKKVRGLEEWRSEKLKV